MENKEQRYGYRTVIRDDIASRFPQDSVLGPLLFNIFLRELSVADENNYFANYVDDTTPYFEKN